MQAQIYKDQISWLRYHAGDLGLLGVDGKL